MTVCVAVSTALLTPPPEYARTLQLLRAAAEGSMNMITPAPIARTLYGCALPGTGTGFTLVEPGCYRPRRRRRARDLRPNERFPELADAIFQLEAALCAGRASDRCLVVLGAQLSPNSLGDVASGQALFVRLGDHRGGELVLRGREHVVRYSPVEFDAHEVHSTRPAEGEEFSLLFFRSSDQTSLATTAARLARAQMPPLQYREDSTDLNVIDEVLRKACYSGPPRGDPRWPDVDWSPAHHTVLDVGAHIGVFARYCLAAGATRIVAIEPEPSNAALCVRNLDGMGAEIRVVAVAHGAAVDGETRKLVLGKERSDGISNTWRHALDGLSHYATPASGTPTSPRGSLDSVPVQVLPLFGPGGVLTDDVTFVKQALPPPPSPLAVHSSWACSLLPHPFSSACWPLSIYLLPHRLHARGQQTPRHHLPRQLPLRSSAADHTATPIHPLTSPHPTRTVHTHQM